MNRILSLESSEQNAVFDGYAERLQIATEKALRDGTLDKGLENYRADKVVLNETQDIRADENTGAITKYYNLTAHNKIKPLQFGKIDTQNSNFMGFYQSKNTGAVRAVFKTSSVTDEYGNVTHEAIVSDDVFQKAQAIFRTRTEIIMPDKPKSVLTGAVKCACCRKSLAFESRYRRVFYCHNFNLGTGCEHSRADEAVLIDTIFAAIKTKLALVQVSERRYVADIQAKIAEHDNTMRELTVKQIGRASCRERV